VTVLQLTIILQTDLEEDEMCCRQHFHWYDG